tara:strand:- start:201 stop:425 length:225 start_codon:yes stop_codon:yes gene_type:complete
MPRVSNVLTDAKSIKNVSVKKEEKRLSKVREEVQKIKKVLDDIEMKCSKKPKEDDPLKPKERKTKVGIINYKKK